MSGSRRVLALAAVFELIVAGGVAAAQTVIVTNARPGSTVELAFNTSLIGSATVEPDGTARLTLNLSEQRGRTGADARIFVDDCGNDRRRLHLVEPGLQPLAPEAGCTRQEVPGVFVMREVTTFVLNVGGAITSVRLRQGPAPPHWLLPQAAGVAQSFEVTAPKGLMLYGSGGFSTLTDVVDSSCGDVTDCTGGNVQFTYTAGVAYWITPFIAAEASYLRPGDVTVEGTGAGQSFDSSLDTYVLSAGGMVGAPIGRGRIYGRAGFAFHRSTSTTTQTIENLTFTVDGVITTISGGTQTFVRETEGRGWLAAGGVEVWLSTRAAIFGEFVYAPLKGDDRAGGDIEFDERLTLFVGGVRFRLF